MKKKVLFVYPELMLGGSTTSLISLLNSLDYHKYEVDLILYKNRGEYFDDLPQQVNVLKESSILHKDSPLSKYKKICKLILSGVIIEAFIYEWVHKKKIGFNNQVISKFYSKNSRELDGKYDVAIGYLELWASYYCLQKVSATKKIIWIHIDYLNAGFIPSLDYKVFKKADKIICVSENCLVNFNKQFPEFINKSMVFENILSSHFIKKRAEEKDEEFDGELSNFDGLKLVTVCRLSIHTKGLDRTMMAAKRLKEQGYHFKWVIIGDGEDRELLEKKVEKEGLKDRIYLIGEKKNPYSYMKQCDVFVMASRREGKPMAVTEAQILGLPVIVTNYSSAKEQVENDQDGIIVENVDEGIYEGIKQVLDNPTLIRKFKEKLSKRQLSNEALIRDFDSMIEKIL